MKLKLYKDGLEDFPWRTIVVENISLMLWLLLGAVLIAQISVLIAGVYIIAAVALIGIVLRKLVCTHCYYYGKRCHVGWGKIAARLFERGDLAQFATCTGSKLPPFVFGTAALLPVIFGVITLIRDFSELKLLMFILLIFFIVLNSVFLRMKSCQRCKMKYLCPGSAAR